MSGERLPNGTPKIVELPRDLADDPAAFEILRVWAQKGQQVVLLRGLHTRKHEEWGIFVADLVRHIARAYELNYGDDPKKVAATIRKLFEIEMDHPTDPGTGNLRD